METKFPEKAAELFSRAAQDAKERYESYLEMSEKK